MSPADRGEGVIANLTAGGRVPVVALRIMTSDCCSLDISKRVYADITVERNALIAFTSLPTRSPSLWLGFAGCSQSVPGGNSNDRVSGSGTAA